MGYEVGWPKISECHQGERIAGISLFVCNERTIVRKSDVKITEYACDQPSLFGVKDPTCLDFLQHLQTL